MLFLIFGLGLLSPAVVVGQFKPKTEYRYLYQVSFSTGISLADSEEAITRMDAELFLRVGIGELLRLQLRNIALANGNIIGKERNGFIPIDDLKPQILTDSDIKLLQLPVTFRLLNGIATNISFSEEDVFWTMNWKLSMISLFENNEEKHRDDTEEEGNQYFTQTGSMVEGECQTGYTVVHEEDKTTAYKTLEFEMCRRRFDVTYNRRFLSYCAECDNQIFIPSTVYHQTLENGILVDSDVKSAYTLAAKDRALMITTGKSRITLQKVEAAIVSDVACKGKKRDDIIFCPAFDLAVDDFLQNGDDIKYNPMKTVPNKLEHAEDIIKKLSKLEKGSLDSAEYFMRLVQYFRISSEHHLDQVQKELYDECSEEERSLINHALAVAGSKNTIKHLLQHSHKFSDFHLLQLLKSVQETPFPSEKITDILLDFLKTKRGKTPLIHQAVWLAYGALIRGIVDFQREKKYVQPTIREKRKFLEVMRKNLVDSETIYDRVLAVKVMANSGLDLAMPVIQSLILDKREPIVVRVEAIEALRIYAEQNPQKIYALLMPVYMDNFEDTELRMVAIREIIEARPVFFVLAQIIDHVERYPEEDLSTFTYIILQAMIKSPLPPYKGPGYLADAILSQSNVHSKSNIPSVYKVWSAFDKDSQYGFRLLYSSIRKTWNEVPATVLLSLETIIEGKWNRRLFQLAMSQQHCKPLLSKLVKKLEELQGELNAPLLRNLITSLESLLSQITGHEEDFPLKESIAMVYFRYKQMDFGMIPFHGTSFDILLDQLFGSDSFKDAIRASSYNLNFTTAGFIFDTMKKISSSLGMPLNHFVMQPTVISTTGTAKIEEDQNCLRIRLTGTAKLGTISYSSFYYWVPSFTGGMKFIRTLELSLPINADLKLAMKRGTNSSISYRLPEKEKVLMKMDSRPIAFVKYFKPNMDKIFDNQEATIHAKQFDKRRYQYSTIAKYDHFNLTLSGVAYHPWDWQTLAFGEHNAELKITPYDLETQEINYVLGFFQKTGVSSSWSIKGLCKLLSLWKFEKNEADNCNRINKSCEISEFFSNSQSSDENDGIFRTRRLFLEFFSRCCWCEKAIGQCAIEN